MANAMAAVEFARVDASLATFSLVRGRARFGGAAAVSAFGFPAAVHAYLWKPQRARARAAWRHGRPNRAPKPLAGAAYHQVHNFLALITIGLLSSEEQKSTYLPAMAKYEQVGGGLHLARLGVP
jgi:hypothetical protein